jgi:protein-tyrosine-phosphatase
MAVKILFVCSGNTCRSPMAAAIAARRFGTAVLTRSAGIACGSEMRAAVNAVEIMAERGVDISMHRSTDIETVDLEEFDIVVALTPAIAHELRRVNRNLRSLVEWDIPDPYGRNLEIYRKTADALDGAMSSLKF